MSALHSGHSGAVEQFVSRKALAARWAVSVETVKRRERAGLIKPVKFNQRLLRYRMSDVLAYEKDATPH